MREIGHFIGGKQVPGSSGRSGDVFNPNIGEVQAKVAFASKAEVEQAIASAEAAQPAWAATNPQRRARVLFKFLELVQKEFDGLARLLSSEHGKTVPIPAATFSAAWKWSSSPAAFPIFSKVNSARAPVPASICSRSGSRSAWSRGSRHSIFRP